MILERLIPVLLLKNRGLVKSVKFKDFTYIGDPINAVRIFNEKEVDELCLIDIEVSKKGLEPDYKYIEEIASEAFIPFAYGGGIINMDRAKRILKIGAEKLIINSALSDLKFIKDLVYHVGSQSVVASIDIKESFFGAKHLYHHTSRKTTSINFELELKKLIDCGIGELLLNSVDMDGTMNGMDVATIKLVSDMVDIPVIACGGAGNLTHVKESIDAGASAVAAGSMFVFHGKHKAVLINYPDRNNLSLVFNKKI